jgi:hypothetical protein
MTHEISSRPYSASMNATSPLFCNSAGAGTNDVTRGIIRSA